MFRAIQYSCPNCKRSLCRTFKFAKTDDEISPEMLAAKDHETLIKCVAAGVLPDVLKRDDITLEVVRTPTAQYLNTETGEVVSRRQMRAAGADREPVEIHRALPIQPYFERDLDADTVVCPMGQTLFYAGLKLAKGKKQPGSRRYHRAAVCMKCPNKCTLAKMRVISFKPGETRIYSYNRSEFLGSPMSDKANLTTKLI